MRYTRNRQLIKATGQTGWKEARVLTIEYMRKAVPDLDHTFKWHRDFEGWGENWIEFGGDECTYGELICVKSNNLHLN